MAASAASGSAAVNLTTNTLGSFSSFLRIYQSVASREQQHGKDVTKVGVLKGKLFSAWAREGMSCKDERKEVLAEFESKNLVALPDHEHVLIPTEVINAHPVHPLLKLTRMCRACDGCGTHTADVDDDDAKLFSEIICGSCLGLGAVVVCGDCGGTGDASHDDEGRCERCAGDGWIILTKPVVDMLEEAKIPAAYTPSLIWDTAQCPLFSQQLVIDGDGDVVCRRAPMRADFWQNLPDPVKKRGYRFGLTGDTHASRFDIVKVVELRRYTVWSDADGARHDVSGFWQLAASNIELLSLVFPHTVIPASNPDPDPRSDALLLFKTDPSSLFSGDTIRFDDAVFNQHNIDVIAFDSFEGDWRFSHITCRVLPTNPAHRGEYQPPGLRSCESLRSFTFNRSLPSFTDYDAFSHCPALEKVDLTPYTKLGALPKRFCRSCSALREVILPANVASIGSAALDDCPRLERVVGFEHVTTFGDQSFENSFASLKSPVAFGAAFTKFPDGMFFFTGRAIRGEYDNGLREDYDDDDDDDDSEDKVATRSRDSNPLVLDFSACSKLEHMHAGLFNIFIGGNTASRLPVVAKFNDHCPLMRKYKSSLVAPFTQWPMHAGWTAESWPVAAPECTFYLDMSLGGGGDKKTRVRFEKGKCITFDLEYQGWDCYEEVDTDSSDVHWTLAVPPFDEHKKRQAARFDGTVKLGGKEYHVSVPENLGTPCASKVWGLDDNGSD